MINPYEGLRGLIRRQIKKDLTVSPPENIAECGEYIAKVLEGHEGYYNYEFHDIAEFIREWIKHEEGGR